MLVFSETLLLTPKVIIWFELTADHIVVEDVNLPATYETIEQAIFDGLGRQPN